MTQEALKLALEALMRSRKAVSGNLDLAGCAYGKNDLDGHRYSDAKKALVTLDKALAAIKEALAQEQEPVAYLHQCEKKPELKELSFKKNEPALSAKGYKSSPLSYTAPPQRTEQEPVAWARYPRYTGKAQLPEIVFKKPDGKDWLELYTHAPQLEQEPVAWRTFDGEGGYDYCSYEDNESYADDWNKRNPNHVGWVDKLYTHAPQRTWVGLTGEEAMDVTRKEGHELLDFIYEYGTGSEGVEERIVAICKAIEAKLKEKNT